MSEISSCIMTIEERLEYALAVRELPNGRLAEAIPLLYGRARICLVNERVPQTYDDVW